jgi:hypothetical protein
MNNTILLETEKIYVDKYKIDDYKCGPRVTNEDFVWQLVNDASFASSIAEKTIASLNRNIIDLNRTISINCSEGDLKLENIYFECKGFSSNSKNKRLNFRKSSCNQYNDETELKKYVKNKVFILHTFMIDEPGYISFKFKIIIGEKLFDNFKSGCICSTKLADFFNTKKIIDISEKEVKFSKIKEEYKLFHELSSLKKPELENMLKEKKLKIKGSRRNKIDYVNLLIKNSNRKKSNRKKFERKKFKRQETFTEKIDKKRKLLKSQNDNLELPFNTKSVGNLLDQLVSI